MKVYVALHTVPDYHAGPAPFVGVAETLAGAAAILYPDRENPVSLFRETRYRYTSPKWEGPDGFGEIRLVEVQP